MEKSTLRTNPIQAVSAIHSLTGRTYNGSDIISPEILASDIHAPVTRNNKVKRTVGRDALLIFDADNNPHIVLDTSVNTMDAALLTAESLGIIALVWGENNAGDSYGLRVDDVTMKANAGQPGKDVRRWLRKFTYAMIMPENAVARLWSEGITQTKMARRFGVTSKIMEDRLKDLDLIADKNKFKRLGGVTRVDDSSISYDKNQLY